MNSASSNTRARELDHLCALSEKVLELIKQEELEEASELELDRQSVTRALFERGDREMLREHQMKLIELQRLDQEIGKALADVCADMRRELREKDVRRTASNAYARVHVL